MQHSELFRAILERRYDVVEALIQNGADVNAKDDKDWTALHVAVAFGSTDPAADMMVLKLLVDAGADVNAKTDDGNTPLHGAATWRSVEMVEFLVSSGADVRAKDEYGVTPLDLAWIRFEDEKTKENAAVHEYLARVVNNQA